MKPRKNRNAKSQAGLGRIGVQVLEPLEQRLLLTATPAGADFLVNTPLTAGEQAYPAVARNDSGSFVVVWTDDGTTNTAGVYARRCNASGVAQGAPLLVAADGAGPAVAMDSAGNFVIAWTADDFSDIYGRRYSASGTPAGGVFMVNAYTAGTQERPGIAMADNGSFAVVWTRQLALDDIDTYARWFSSSGPVTGEILVSGGTGVQWDVDVAANADGSSFVAVLCANNIGDGQPDIVARRFDGTGQGVGQEFAVNTYTDGGQVRPDVAMDDGGNFMVVWAGAYADGVDDGVVGQRYDSSGVAQGANFLINDPDAVGSIQGSPAVAACVTGFEVVWDLSLTFDDYDIRGRSYDNAGVAQGAELGVNAYTTGFQAAPAIAMNDQGNFVVAWWGEGAADAAGVYARLYTTSDTPVKPSVSIAATDATAAETLAGELANPGTFRISRTTTGGALTVYFTHTGTATFGPTADYTLGVGIANLTTTSAVIPEGDDHVDITVTPLDDALAEPAQTVVLTLAAKPAYTLDATAANRTATVTILDNEPVVSIAATDATAAETAPADDPDTGTFRISRTTTTGALTVCFTHTGTATFGPTGDYTLGLLTTTSAVIPDGVDHVDVTVTPRDDPLAEPAQTVVLTLAAKPAYHLDPTAANRTATVTILDNEPVVSLAATDATAAETLVGELANTGTFRISRLTTAGALTVYFTRTGTATFGPTADYTLSLGGANLTTTSAVIPDGEDHVDVTVTPRDDPLAEPAQTVVLTLAARPAYNLDPTAANRTATVTILDNEPVVSIAAADATAAETTPDDDPDSGAFTITRSGDTANPLNVMLQIGGTEGWGDPKGTQLKVNGVALGTNRVTIPEGQSSVTVTVVPGDDFTVEPTKAMVLTLTKTSAYSMDPTAANRTATVTILDNEPTISLVVFDNQATEDSPDTGIFRIHRTGSTYYSLTVPWKLGGTARGGTDYRLKLGAEILYTNVATIPAGQSDLDIIVAAQDLNIPHKAQGARTVIMTLSTQPKYRLDLVPANLSGIVGILDG
jgi:hypothetical protein